jgi:hypothetical protein
MLGHGAMSEAGPGGLAGGPMMMPPGGMRGGGQGGQEAVRRAYLPQEAEAWGTEPEFVAVPSAVGIGGEHSQDAESEFVAVASAVGIGGEHSQDAEPEFVPVASAAVGLGAPPDQVQ